MERALKYLEGTHSFKSFTKSDEEKDFVYYYFMNQYMWNFFPENSREKIRNKSGKSARKYRKEHPDKPLKIRFWPKKFLEAFNGMEQYDPYFGENFYNDTFNCNIDYSKLLSEINCKTLFMKANTKIADDGIIMGALTDDDLPMPRRAVLLNSGKELPIRFDTIPSRVDADAVARKNYYSIREIPVDEYPAEPLVLAVEWA